MTTLSDLKKELEQLNARANELKDSCSGLVEPRLEEFKDKLKQYRKTSGFAKITAEGEELGAIDKQIKSLEALLDKDSDSVVIISSPENETYPSQNFFRKVLDDKKPEEETKEPEAKETKEEKEEETAAYTGWCNIS